jgi:hypothetical protein
MIKKAGGNGRLKVTASSFDLRSTKSLELRHLEGTAFHSALPNSSRRSETTLGR